MLERLWRWVPATAALSQREPVVSDRRRCQSEATGGPISSLLPITSRRFCLQLLACCCCGQNAALTVCDVRETINFELWTVPRSQLNSSERNEQKLVRILFVKLGDQVHHTASASPGDVDQARSAGQLVASLAQWRRPAHKQMCKSSLDGYKHTQRGPLAVWLHFTQRRWCLDRF